MNKIREATILDAIPLAELARTTFKQSHGHSASESEINNYMSLNFLEAVFNEELSDPNNRYYLIYDDQKLVGYSKLILNTSTNSVAEQNIAKLERIYVLEEAHGLGLGKRLFDVNVKFARENNQSGIWLFTWIENHRAIRFYQKLGFQIVGKYDFRISDTHSNPNHQLYLKI